MKIFFNLAITALMGASFASCGTGPFAKKDNNKDKQSTESGDSKKTDEKTSPTADKTLVGRTYAHTIKCKPMMSPSDQMVDCRGFVSFLEDNKASYLTAGDDQVHVWPYSRNGNEIKLEGKEFNPPITIIFKLAADEKSLADEGGTVWALEDKSSEGKALVGRTYAHTIKCKPIMSPSDQMVDCRGFVNFLDDGKASYLSAGDDQVHVWPYSRSGNEVKLEGKEYNPPIVLIFKLSSDEKTMTDDGGTVWQLEEQKQ